MTPTHVWIVSLEWERAPSEVTGDPGISGVYATEALAGVAAAQERAELHAQGHTVAYYSREDGAYCGSCGEACSRGETGRPLACAQCAGVGDEGFCPGCGAELTSTGTCDNDHDEWTIDVHVTAHQVRAGTEVTSGD